MTITPVFWAPAGYSFPSGYNSLIDQYLADVAAASGTNGNVFGVAQEYYQQFGGNPKAFISYHVTAGAELDASDAYPAEGGVSGCTAESGFGLTACVTDGALQTEVASVVSAHSLTADDSHIYMVFFPPNVQTCFGPGTPTSVGCSYSGPGSNGQYCGYHSGFSPGGNTELYANEPFIPLSGCSLNQAPNGNAEADAEVSIISHEANETITDYANAWRDSAGYEIGDECAYTYGAPLGGSEESDNAYNQVINGHDYFTQDEFSNAAYALGEGDINYDGGSQVLGCIQRPSPIVTPTVSAVSPSNGPSSGGTPITITGTGFVAGATVEIGQGTYTTGAIAATSVVVVSGTTITAVTGGATKAGTFNLFVTTTGGTSVGNAGDDFTYNYVTPTVSAVSPNHGPSSGGTPITITGTGFIAGATVAIGQGNGTTGAIAATSVVVVNSTTITAVTGGATKVGTFNLYVTTTGGTSTGNAGDDYTYGYVAPTVSLVSPNNGPKTGGTPITITGTGFTTGATVVIGQGNGLTGAIAATSVVVVNSKQITAVTGGGAKVGTFNLIVITSGGTSAGNAGDSYTYH